ncbi:coat protein [Lamium leaf distortion virus]|uniref:Coat protein n=1 Tax=Lamium leaf distortion virus TaxID=515320 RepID=B2CXY4_9VIRU|nr:coat protein [Lamium leaf distortion virus]ACB69766.1 coat protein [Lamium leaf distortion virus]
MSFYELIDKQFWETLETQSELDERLNTLSRLVNQGEQATNEELQGNETLRSFLNLDNICERFETLNVIEESSEDSSIDNNDPVDYSDSSSEEEEQNTNKRFFMEKGEGSQNKKDKDPKVEYPNVENLQSEDNRRTPFNNNKRKSPEQARYPVKPKFEVVSRTLGFLDIDCQDHEVRKKNIDAWASELSLIVQTNPDAYDNADAVILLAEHKALGNAKELIKGTYWNKDNPPMYMLNQIFDSLYSMFLGLDYTDAISKLLETNKQKENARIRLANLKLCNICSIDEFNCAYEEEFFKLNQNEYPKYISDYLLKIPVVGLAAKEKFDKTTGTLAYSIGHAEKLVREEITKICELSQQQKKLKKISKKCCNKIANKSTDIGCYTTKSYKKKKKKKFKKYVFSKRKRKKFRPGKYFQKKKFPTSGEGKKPCPKGKTNCRCWICNVEGHYANKCPNKQKYGEKVKILRKADLQDLEPIEDIFEESLDVYIAEIIEFDPDLSYQESSDESSEESD